MLLALHLQLTTRADYARGIHPAPSGEGRLPATLKMLLPALVPDQASGELADRMAESSGTERILEDLAAAGALDGWSWFRYGPPAGPQDHERAESQAVPSGSPGKAPLPEATLPEPLTSSETRILRYLATTHLPVPEIARQLFISVNTVRTHMRHIYAKLGAHRRSEAVERARDLGLLAHSRRPMWSPDQIALPQCGPGRGGA